MNGKQQIIAALHAAGFEACAGKGGFFVRGRGFLTYCQAKSLAGLNGRLTDRAAPRPRVVAYGEWAVVAAVNRCL